MRDIKIRITPIDRKEIDQYEEPTFFKRMLNLAKKSRLSIYAVGAAFKTLTKSTNEVAMNIEKANYIRKG